MDNIGSIKVPQSRMKSAVISSANVWLGLSLLVLTGCNTMNSHFRVSPVIDHPKTAGANGGTGDNRDGYLKPIDLDNEVMTGDKTNLLAAAAGQEKLAIQNAGKQQNAVADVATNFYRNELQNRILERSDEICEKHKGDILGSSASTNFTLGWGAATASALSAIVTGAAATNYAAGATILNAGRSEINGDVYQGLLATAIIKAINESRDKKLTEIKANQSKSPSKYSVRSAIVDAQDYHFRCSFYHGLVVLNQDAKQRAALSRDEIKARIEERQAKLDELKGPDDKEARDKIRTGRNGLLDQLNLLDQGK